MVQRFYRPIFSGATKPRPQKLANFIDRLTCDAGADDDDDDERMNFNVA